MRPIFFEKDFRLCCVPVPKGYPQSQTHVGVSLKDNLILLSSSPYPSFKRPLLIEYIRAAIRRFSGGYLCKSVRGEYYENPCLYYSIDGVNFTLMQSRPLMEPPDAYYGLPAFNSDPDLFVDDGTIYVINRAIFRTKLTPGKNRDEYDIRLYLIEGLLDNGRFKYISTRLFKETTDLIVSPCLTKYRGDYIFMSLWTNCYNDGVSFEGLRYVSSSNINRLSKQEDWQTIQIDTSKWIPWHMSVFSCKEKLYAIVACVERGKSHRCWQMLGEFDEDLERLIIYPKPLTDYDSYRGAAYVDEKGIFVLYSTTVREKIKGGKAIDGREIIMAQMPFEELLLEERDNSNNSEHIT